MCGRISAILSALDLEISGDLCDSGTSTELGLEASSGLDDLVEELAGVYGDANRAAAVGNAPGDCLADPPGGVRGELEALAPVESLNGVHQPEVALLHEVQQRHPGGPVSLGDRYHQTEVAVGEGLHCRVSGPDDPT